MKEAHSLTRVMIADAHELVRAGMRTFLEKASDVVIVGEATSAEETLATLEKLAASPQGCPDILVVDTRLPDGSGIDVCRLARNRYGRLRVILLTALAEEEPIFAAIAAGAHGYMLKQVSGEDLLRAVRAVKAGGGYLDADTTARLLTRLRNGRSALASLSMAERRMQAVSKGKGATATVANAQSSETPGGFPEPLNEQERRILALIAEGKTNREIAEGVYLSEKTVRNYVSNILGKLNLSNRAEAAAFAVRHGLSVAG